jgi:hypothetical protein
LNTVLVIEMEFIREGMDYDLYYKGECLLEWCRNELILYGDMIVLCGIFPHEYITFVFCHEQILRCDNGEITAFNWMYDLYRRLYNQNTKRVSFENIAEPDVQHLLESVNISNNMNIQLDESAKYVWCSMGICDNHFLDGCRTRDESSEIVRQILLRRPTAAKSARN